MKKLLPKTLLSLGVLIMAGGGFAASASAAPYCAYPSSGGLLTNTTTVPSGSTGTCWTTNSVNDGSAPSTVPVATTLPTPTTSTSVAASPGVRTASVAPIITTSATTGLAFTGADIWQSVVVGVILIGSGLLVIRLARRRRTRNLS